jgi:hypothetical protein
VTGAEAATSEAAASEAADVQATLRTEATEQTPDGVPEVTDEEKAKAERLAKREAAMARKRARGE